MFMSSQSLSWESLRSARVSVPNSVVHRAFAQETVLLNIDTGYYHGMDAIGGRFFDVLRTEPTVADAARVLAEEYEQPEERIQADIVAFCASLLELRLIELTYPGA
jgi:hypothetical protein